MVTAYKGTDESVPSKNATAFQIKITSENCGLGDAQLPPELRTGCTAPLLWPLFSGIDNAILADFMPDQAQTLGKVASSFGYDHFNWISTISYLPPSVTEFKDWQKKQLPPVDPVTGTPLPYFDPPLGGYDYWHNDITTSCGSSGPTNDFRPYYWDEQLGCVPGVFLQRYLSPAINPADLGFFDHPHSSQLGPLDYWQFVTSLVGVPNGSGAPTILATFFWSTNNHVSGVGRAQGVSSASGAGGIFNVGIVDSEQIPAAVKTALIQAGVQGVSSAPKTDRDAPMTAAMLSGPQGANGWFVGPVQVALIATDIDGPSDIAETTYSVDAGFLIAYSSPFTVSGDSLHTVPFSSSDRAGNIETPRPSQTIQLDATPPAILCSANLNPQEGRDGRSVEITVSGTMTDITSGVDTSSPAYVVTDEDGQVLKRGSIAPGNGGSYSFGVSLLSERHRREDDDRALKVQVNAKDRAGNVGSCSSEVLRRKVRDREDDRRDKD